MLFADVIALLAVAAAKEDAALRQVPGIAATKQRSGAKDATVRTGSPPSTRTRA